MTVSELIEILKQYPKDTKVKVWHPWEDDFTSAVTVNFIGEDTISIEVE